MKTCGKCRESKPLSEFGQHSQTRDGLKNRCRACVAEEAAAYNLAATERNARVLAGESPDGEKECSRCGVSKPYGAFQRRSRSKDGFASDCKECRSTYMKAHRAARPDLRRRQTLRGKYGMEPEDYDALLVAQDGRCAICQKLPTSENSRFGILYVDHDHMTGAVRGLLCDQCNRGIGLLQDNPDTLMAAAAYLLARQTTSEDKEKADA